MKRFLKALPLLLVGGLALAGCGTVDVDVKVQSADKMDVTISMEASDAEMNAYIKQGTGIDDAAAANKYSLGALLQGNVNSLRLPSQQGSPGMDRPDSVTIEENNEGDQQKAQAVLKGLPNSALATTAFQAKVSYEAEHYTFSAVRPKDASLGKAPAADGGEASETAPVALTVEFPNPVSEATAGGEVHGKSVTWHLKDIKENTTLTAVTSGPGMAWWVSGLLWLAGIAVTVLLIAITLMSAGARNERKDAAADAEPTEA